MLEFFLYLLLFIGSGAVGYAVTAHNADLGLAYGAAAVAVVLIILTVAGAATDPGASVAYLEALISPGLLLEAIAGIIGWFWALLALVSGFALGAGTASDLEGKRIMEQERRRLQ